MRNIGLIIIVILSLFELWIGFKFINLDEYLIFHTATFSFVILLTIILIVINIINYRLLSPQQSKEDIIRGVLYDDNLDVVRLQTIEDTLNYGRVIEDVDAYYKDLEQDDHKLESSIDRCSADR